MRHLILPLALLTLGLVVLAVPAQADSIDWRDGTLLPGSTSGDTTTGGGGDYKGTSLTFSYTGGTMTLTGYEDDGATASQVYYDRNVQRSGMGVYDGGFGGDNEQIDVAGNELLRLTFSTQVEITGLWFANRDHGTNFTGGYAGNFVLNGSSITLAGSVSLAAGSQVGTVFNFTAPNEDYYLSGITFTVNPVPEPTSVALFALGAGGLALVRRRRRNAPA